MKLKHLLIAVPATLSVLAPCMANAGQTIAKVGAIACVVGREGAVKGPQAGRLCWAMRQRPQRPCCPAVGHRRLRRELRIYA